VNDNIVVDLQPDSKVKYCLREITTNGSCLHKTPPFRRDCRDEFMAMGSWTMAKNCECQPLLDNKRRCSCCINCLDEEAKLLGKALHLKEIEDTHDRCSNL
jgi:hypothetical protein